MKRNMCRTRNSKFNVHIRINSSVSSNRSAYQEMVDTIHASFYLFSTGSQRRDVSYDRFAVNTNIEISPINSIWMIFQTPMADG